MPEPASRPVLRALHGQGQRRGVPRTHFTGGVHLRGRREAARARADREDERGGGGIAVRASGRSSRPSARHPEARHAAACGRRGVRRTGRDRVRAGADPGVRVRAALRRRLAAKQGIHPVPPDRGRPGRGAVRLRQAVLRPARRRAEDRSALARDRGRGRGRGVPVLARRTKGRAGRTAERRAARADPARGEERL